MISHVPRAATVSAGSSDVAPEGQHGGVSPLHFPTHMSRSDRALLVQPCLSPWSVRHWKKRTLHLHCDCWQCDGRPYRKIHLLSWLKQQHWGDLHLYLCARYWFFFFYTSQIDTVTLFEKNNILYSWYKALCIWQTDIEFLSKNIHRSRNAICTILDPFRKPCADEPWWNGDSLPCDGPQCQSLSDSHWDQSGSTQYLWQQERIHWPL